VFGYLWCQNSILLFEVFDLLDHLFSMMQSHIFSNKEKIGYQDDEEEVSTVVGKETSEIKGNNSLEYEEIST